MTDGDAVRLAKQADVDRVVADGGDIAEDIEHLVHRLGGKFERLSRSLVF